MKLQNILALAFFLMIASFKSYATDSVYIKFINKFIESETLDVNTFRLNSKTYILKQINDSTLECYIIKKNVLVCYGLLKIKIEKNVKVANRNEYWSFYKKPKRYETTFYYNDKKINDEKINATKEIGVFPPYSTEYIRQ